MTAASAFTAVPREIIGKANRRLAGQNQIPAVLYGRGHAPVALSLDRHEFELFMGHHAAGSTIVDLTIEGTKGTVSAMIRDIQRSAVKSEILHVDFLAVSMDKPVHATVPLHLVNDPAGVKAGGVLNISVHELNVEAKPGDLPQFIEFDASAIEMGESVHVRDLAAPKGVTLLDEADAVVASVIAPRGEEEEVSEEVVEPEVIGSKDNEE